MVFCNRFYDNRYYEDRYVWSLYDTISGEVCRIGVEEVDCRGIYYPSLAVRGASGRIQYINPALVYPHTHMEWGVIPVGELVMPEDV
ncbi:hypothetical protein KIPB_006209 [Kipferlia bialata]|uniref:Uncharacterized protein n=1 Tax=Kipferlia bialata TaxID=797122 RepID=A0A9K3CWP2_9EUKA|nr:hypothetical protein KIPB_006209 [Kipferlia bialata]|eukprot:g6209.t1